MGFSVKKKKLSVGLSIEGEEFHLMMIEGGGGYRGVLKSAHGIFPKEILKSGNIYENFGANLDPVFKFVVEKAGGISEPVNLGLPAAESLLRIVNMPGLSLEDSKQAFRFEVENYFPFPASDSVYDIAEIEWPVGENAVEKRFLVAAARKTLLENITRAASLNGMALASLEPSQLALERAAGAERPIEDSCVYIYAGGESSVLILSWRGCGIFYRNIPSGLGEAVKMSVESEEYSAAATSFSRDVQSTLQFALSQNRALSVKSAYLFGPGASQKLRDTLKEWTSIEGIALIDVMRLHGINFETGRGGWETALGLALR